MTQSDSMPELQSFLTSLRQGDFGEELEQAFEQLNQTVSGSKTAREFLQNHMLQLATGGRNDRMYLMWMARCAMRYQVPAFAHLVAGLLVRVCATADDEDLLSLAVGVITRYDLGDLTSVESDGQALRLEAYGFSRLLPTECVSHQARLGLLLVALHKYTRLLTCEGVPNGQELSSTVGRLNAVIRVLVRSEAKAEFLQRRGLWPFIEDVTHSAERCLRLFGAELGSVQYEEELLSQYGVPLFPVLPSDKLVFDGHKVTFTNEGPGSLPPAVVKIRVGDSEFELGNTGHTVEPQSVDCLFADEATLARFLSEQSRNHDVEVLFSFGKFQRSYELVVLGQPVGAWLEQIPMGSSDAALPYDVLLEKLNEKDFEKLCEWIVALDPEKRFTKVLRLNENGGGERGRDVLAVEVATGRDWVFQCKRVAEFGPADVQAELAQFAQYVVEDPSIKPDVYVFFLSCAITDKSKAKGDAMASEIGMEIEYWTRTTIDRLVRMNPPVKERFWRLIQQ